MSFENEWREVTLGDIAEGSDGAVDGPFGSNLKASYYQESGIPIIRGSNLSVGLTEFDESEFVFVGDDTFNRLKRSECVKGDIIFTKKGTLGQTGFIKENSKFSRYLLSSNQMRLRVDTSIADPEYIYHLVSSRESIDKLKQDSEFTGVPKINLDYLKKFPVKLPSLSSQKSSVKVLSGLTNKIAINTKINKSLENVAQAIFKSWFVDFEPTKAKIAAREALLAEKPDATPEQISTAEEQAAIRAIAGAGDVIPTQQLQSIADLFANHLVDSEVGEIPYGWEVNRLIELINITGGGTPKRSESSFWGGDISWFSVRDVPNSSDIFVTRTEEKITELGLKKSSTKLIPKGSTIITARGTVGKLALVAEDMCMNQSCYAISSDRFGDFYNYFNLRQSVETLKRNTHGAVFDTITTRTFETYSLAYGGDEISSVFDTVVEPIMKRIELNVRQNSLLSEVRDTLLPKLLSGQMQAI